LKACDSRSVNGRKALTETLDDIEIRVGRNSALMELTSKLPAVALSQLIGIHITTAET
jgi:hypothetical protein